MTITEVQEFIEQQAAPHMVMGDYYLSSSQLRALVEFAYAAGDKHGVEHGGNVALAAMEKVLGAAAANVSHAEIAS
jgi:hypothetical protein